MAHMTPHVAPLHSCGDPAMLSIAQDALEHPFLVEWRATREAPTVSGAAVIVMDSVAIFRVDMRFYFSANTVLCG